MALRYPTSEEFINSIKHHPAVLLSGIVFGVTAGYFIGNGLGTSGNTALKEQVQLLREQRDKYKENLESSEKIIDRFENLIKTMEMNQKSYGEKCANIIEDNNSTIEKLKNELQAINLQHKNLENDLSTTDTKSKKLIVTLREEIENLKKKRRRDANEISILSTKLEDLGITDTNDINDKVQKLSDLLDTNLDYRIDEYTNLSELLANRVIHVSWHSNRCALILTFVKNPHDNKKKIECLVPIMEFSRVANHSTIQLESHTRCSNGLIDGKFNLIFPDEHSAAVAVGIINSIKLPNYCKTAPNYTNN